MDTVVLEAGATLGPHCVVLPAARIGAGATVGPASLVMRGDEVPPSTRWQGNPIRPWKPPQDGSQEVRPRARPGPAACSTLRPRRLPQIAAKPAVIDPYLPKNGNPGYRVSRYELELEYKVSINRLSGTATITAVTLTELHAAHARPVRRADGVEGVGQRQARRPFACTHGKLRIRLASKLATGAAISIVVRYGGSPRPLRSLVGRRRFRGADRRRARRRATQRRRLVVPVRRPPQRQGRLSASRSAPKARYRVVANGKLVSRRARAARRPWTYEQPEPTSTYLITLQIGDVRDGAARARRRCRCRPRCPSGCAATSTTTSPANPR